MARCAYRRAILQRPGGEADQLAEKVLGEHHGQSPITLGELSTVVAEATQMVNSGPIVRNSWDPETGGPITPLHMLLGPASAEITRMKFDEAPRLTQRLQFISEAKEQFWDK